MSQKEKAKFKLSWQESNLLEKPLSLSMIPMVYVIFIFYKEVKLNAEIDPVVIFESTGHYHEPVLQYLEERRITYYLVNPVVFTKLKRVAFERLSQTHLVLDIYENSTTKKI